MRRRVYYDHEPAYRSRRDRGYTGWGPPDCADADNEAALRCCRKVGFVEERVLRDGAVVLRARRPRWEEPLA